MSCAHEHTTKPLVCVTHNECHVRTSTLLSLHYVSLIVSDMYAQTHYHDSSLCHPWWITYIQEFKKIHYHGSVRKNTLPCLWYMPIMLSDIYARTHPCVSSTCHLWRVACIQDQDSQNPSLIIPWLILQRACKTQGSPLVSLIGCFSKGLAKPKVHP